MKGVYCSWYNAEGYLRVDKAFNNGQRDAMERHCMNTGGTDFQTGIEATKRPKKKVE